MPFPTHYIWDFDGTLFDTYPGIVSAFRSALNDMGHDIPSQAIMDLLLRNFSYAKSVCREMFGLDLERFSQRYRVHRNTQLGTLPAPFPGARETLEGIVARGGKNYIFTHNDRRVFYVLNTYRMDHLFTEIVTRENEFPDKPSPEGILYLLRKHDLRPEDTVMIGDRELDLGSGRSAGTHTCHFLNADVPQLLHCDLRVHDLREILAFEI